MKETVQEILSRPSLVLIIDAWNDRDSDQYRQCMTNIKTFCETNSHIVAVGLASYTGTEKHVLAHEEPWYNQSCEFFYDKVRWETLRQVWNDAEFITGTTTHEIVKNIKIRADQRQFLIWHNLQVLYYCNYINPGIENIYILGTAWEECLRFRSVGYRELSSLNDCNLFSKTKTILSRIDCTLEVGDLPVTDVQYPWVELNKSTVMLDKGYRA